MTDPADQKQDDKSQGSVHCTPLAEFVQRVRELLLHDGAQPWRPDVGVRGLRLVSRLARAAAANRGIGLRGLEIT